MAARGGRNAAGSLAGPPGSQPQFLRESAPSPFHSQSSVIAFQRATEPTSPNRTRRLREPISCCRGGGAGLIPPSSRDRLQIKCGDSLSPIIRGLSARGVSSGSSPPTLPTRPPHARGAPLIDVRPGAGSAWPTRRRGGVAFLTPGAAGDGGSCRVHVTNTPFLWAESSVRGVEFRG